MGRKNRSFSSAYEQKASDTEKSGAWSKCPSCHHALNNSSQSLARKAIEKVLL